MTHLRDIHVMRYQYLVSRNEQPEARGRIAAPILLRKKNELYLYESGLLRRPAWPPPCLAPKGYHWFIRNPPASDCVTPLPTVGAGPGMRGHTASHIHKPAVS